MKKIKIFYVFAAIILLSGMMYSCERIIYGDEDANGSSSFGGNNNLKAGQIEMKVIPDSRNSIDFSATVKKITIDWGDGSIDELTPNGVRRTFTHEYLNRNLQTVKVNTDVMTMINFGGNSIYGGTKQEIRFGYCPELKTIDCSSNALTVLDVSKCSTLTSLNCSRNPLISINVSGCTALTILDCYSSRLTSLNTSSCIALTNLDCQDNQLISLNISGCKALYFLECRDNQLSASALNALFNSLPTRKPDDWASISCGYNPGYTTCDKTIAEKKGWCI